MSTNQLNLLSESELLEAQPGYTIHGEPSRRVSSRDDSRHAHTGLLRYKGLYVTLSLLEINIVCSNQLGACLYGAIQRDGSTLSVGCQCIIWFRRLLLSILGTLCMDLQSAIICRISVYIMRSTHVAQTSGTARCAPRRSRL